MQKTIQIKCIRRANHWKPRGSISHVGGGALANRWKLELDEVIQKIESRDCMFFVNVGSDPVAVKVAVDPDGTKYIKTVADGDFPAHLLNLPECPEDHRERLSPARALFAAARDRHNPWPRRTIRSRPPPMGDKDGHQGTDRMH